MNEIRTRVDFTLLDILTVPLTDARAASVGKDETTGVFESTDLAITFNGGTDLLGTGGNGELGFDLNSMIGSLLGDGSRAGHILIRRVGARTDESNLELLGPVVLLNGSSKLGDGGSKIRSEGAVDMGLKLGEVDLDHLVVLCVLVGLQVVLERVGILGNLRTLGRVEILSHALVVREEGGSGTNFSTHVANGGHARAGERFNTRTSILDDSTSATLDGENASDLEDNI